MNVMLKYVVVCYLSVVAIVSFGQVPTKKALVVGDKLSFDQMHNMINYPKKTLNMSDIKAKLVIIDSWGISCTTCVASWPKLLALQKEFGNDLQIILLNRFERESLIKPFVEKRKRVAGVDMDLPMTLRDTTLWDVFPKRALPTIYWIDKDRKLVSITSGKELTAENVRQAIAGNLPQMPQWIDKYETVDISKPMFVDGNGGGSDRSKTFLWSSSLTEFQREVWSPSGSFTDVDGRSGILAVGETTGLYRLAYKKNSNPRTGEVVLLQNEIEFYEGNSSQQSRHLIENDRNKRFVYQLIGTGSKNRDSLLMLMREDLKRYFGYEAFYKKVTKACLVLSLTDKFKVLPPRGPIDIWLSETEGTIDSVSVKMMIRFMREATYAYRYSEYPIVDETNYTGLLGSIFLEGNCLDHVQLDKMLRKFGMKLTVEPREVEVLVVRTKT